MKSRRMDGQFSSKKKKKKRNCVLKTTWNLYLEQRENVTHANAQFVMSVHSELLIHPLASFLSNGRS